MKYQATLDSKSIKSLIDDLKDYRSSLRSKSERLVERLLEEGIKVAYQHVGRYAGYVEFTKEIDNQSSRCIGILIGQDTQPFISRWVLKDGTVREATVSGILMSEFGSGWLANVIWNVSGVGQGSFPGQEHAFDTGGWYWVDEQGVKHHSKGEEPHYPMYFADMTMLSQIDSIAREVFHGI